MKCTIKELIEILQNTDQPQDMNVEYLIIGITPDNQHNPLIAANIDKSKKAFKSLVDLFAA